MSWAVPLIRWHRTCEQVHRNTKSLKRFESLRPKPESSSSSALVPISAGEMVDYLQQGHTALRGHDPSGPADCANTGMAGKSLGKLLDTEIFRMDDDSLKQERFLVGKILGHTRRYASYRRPVEQKSARKRQAI